MYPAVCVDDFFGDFFVMYAINWVADILPCGDYHTKGQQYHDCDAVVQTEHWRINVDMWDLNEILQTPKYVQHRDGQLTTVYKQ